jgi:nucleoside-diphosphate-sugar epimerase
MNIVVTGAIGHIGSRLIRDLAVDFPASKITLIDNLLTQRYPSIFNLPKSAEYRFIDADVRNADLKALLSDVEVMIHLAAITDAAGSFENAELVEANNYDSTSKILEFCKESGTRLITLSSTSVYGTQEQVVSEDCDQVNLNPQSPYAATKIREEELVNKYVTQHGVKAVSCRFGTIFGVSPGMRFHTAVNKFCWQAVMKQPLTVWSTAYEQKRPYLDLSDATRALSFIIRKDIFDGEIYNVLSKNATVREIVEIIRLHVPDLVVQFVDNEIMNQLSYEVANEKFSKKGFEFKGDLNRGIRETIALLSQANSLRG